MIENRPQALSKGSAACLFWGPWNLALRGLFVFEDEADDTNIKNSELEILNKFNSKRFKNLTKSKKRRIR